MTVRKVTMKNGDAVHCHKCGAIVLVATRDISYGTVLREGLFIYPNGTDLKSGTWECPSCQQKFVSVDTEKRMTMGKQ